MKVRRHIALKTILSMLTALLCPVSAFADKGSSHGSGGGSNGSGSSGSSNSSNGSNASGGSNSSGSSATSGNSRSSGSSGDDHSGKSHEEADDKGTNSSQSHTGRQENVFTGGWRERLHVGQYEVFDPDGRLVIRRPPTPQDLKRFN